MATLILAVNNNTAYAAGASNDAPMKSQAPCGNNYYWKLEMFDQQVCSGQINAFMNTAHLSTGACNGLQL